MEGSGASPRSSPPAPMNSIQTEVRLPIAEWRALPKDGWDGHVRVWCRRHGHLSREAVNGHTVWVPCKLPYRADPQDRNFVLVAKSFLDMPKKEPAPKPGEIETLGRFQQSLRDAAKPSC